MSEWKGLHNPERHRVEASGLTSCRRCADTGCSPESPCYCCLAAEVERLNKRINAAVALLGNVEPSDCGCNVCQARQVLRGDR